MPVTVRIVVADDQAVVRAGFRTVLEAEPDLTVVAEVSSGEAAVRAARSLRPDLVLMDVRMPGGDGITATARAGRAGRRRPGAGAGGHDLRPGRVRLRGAARRRQRLPAQGRRAGRAGRRGPGRRRRPRACLAPQVTRRLIAEFARSSAPRPAPPTLAALTDREREILPLVARGLSNAEIAAHLVLSPATVKTHVGNLLAKIGCQNRVQAVVFAYEHGIVAPTP